MWTLWRPHDYEFKCLIVSSAFNLISQQAKCPKYTATIYFALRIFDGGLYELPAWMIYYTLHIMIGVITFVKYWQNLRNRLFSTNAIDDDVPDDNRQGL